MSHEDLVTCIEKAFGELDRPLPEELAADDTYMDKSFVDGVGARTWLELRPLRHYIGDGSEIVLLSATAYRYYIPAYLVALVNESAEDFYLNGVLDSLWYESGLASRDNSIEEFFDPRRGVSETQRELETEIPDLTDQQRRTAAETRVNVAAKLARLKKLTGHDFFDESHLCAALRARWEERMPLLTDQQKECIAQLLVHILGRTNEVVDSVRIQNMLDKYWKTWL